MDAKCNYNGIRNFDDVSVVFRLDFGNAAAEERRRCRKCVKPPEIVVRLDDDEMVMMMRTTPTPKSLEPSRFQLPMDKDQIDPNSGQNDEESDDHFRCVDQESCAARQRALYSAEH